MFLKLTVFNIHTNLPPCSWKGVDERAVKVPFRASASHTTHIEIKEAGVEQ